MNFAQKLLLATRIWAYALIVHFQLRTRLLPKVVSGITPRGANSMRQPGAEHLGRIVRRVLTVFGRPPRCLIASLVAYRLLKAQGQPVELVIGLPREPADKDAHAWLEIDGRDVGPPPGQAGHIELARYG